MKGKSKRGEETLIADKPLGYLVIYSLWSFVPVEKNEAYFVSYEGPILEEEAGFAIVPGPGLPKNFPLPLSPKGPFISTHYEKLELMNKRKSKFHKLTGAHLIFSSFSKYVLIKDVGAYEVVSDLDFGKKSVLVREKTSFSVKGPSDVSGNVTNHYDSLDLSKYEEKEVEEFYRNQLKPKPDSWLDMARRALFGDSGDIFLSASKWRFHGESVNEEVSSLFKTFLSSGSKAEGIFELVVSSHSSLASEKLGKACNECLALFKTEGGFPCLAMLSYGKQYFLVLGKDPRETILFSGREGFRDAFSGALAGKVKVKATDEIKSFFKDIGVTPKDADSLIVLYSIPIEAIFVRGIDQNSIPKTDASPPRGTSLVRSYGIVGSGWKVSSLENEEPYFEGNVYKKVPVYSGGDGRDYYSTIDDWKENERHDSMVGKLVQELSSNPDDPLLRSLYLVFSYKKKVLDQEVCVSGKKRRVRDFVILEPGKEFFDSFLMRRVENLDFPTNPKVLAGKLLDRFNNWSERAEVLLVEFGNRFFVLEKGKERIILPGDRLYGYVVL